MTHRLDRHLVRNLYRSWPACALALALLVPACVDDPSVAPGATIAPPSEEEAISRPLTIDARGDRIAAGEVPVELVNQRPVAVDVALNVNVTSPAGLAQRHGVRVERLEPYQRLELTLTTAELPLPATGDVQLSVTAEAVFEDGERRSPTSAPLALAHGGAAWRAVTPAGDDAVVTARRSRPDAVERELAPEHAFDPASPLQPGTAELLVARRLCFRVATTYQDSGVGEDFWTNTGPTFRTIRGADVEVTHPDGSFTGQLFWDGDLAGCVEAAGRGLQTGDKLTLRLFTTGLVRGHAIRVEDETTGNRASASITVTYTEASETWYDVSPSAAARARFNIYVAAAYAAYGHGGLAGSSVTIYADAAGGSVTGTNEIWITTGDWDNKFTITHEFGHHIARSSTGLHGNGTCDDYRTGAGNNCDSAAAHTMRSKEIMRCAAVEGFADFYAADVFNMHDEDDCMILNGGATVNCEGANAGFPLRMMETNCTGTGSHAGMGNETDWMRTFWDVHTNGANPPTMNDMLRWIEDANDTTAWSNSNPYQLLDAEANDKGGTLNSIWDVAAAENGIDH